MGRKKIDIKKISDEKTLLVTFAKRKVGLFNKAFELSELCECEVAILILTNKQRMHMFASHDMGSVVKRYNDRPNRGELITSQNIIERRKKKKQLKSLQSDVRSLNQPSLSSCDCGNGEYDGGMHDESLVPTTASTDYDGQLSQLELPQQNAGTHLKPFYPADDVEGRVNAFQDRANDYNQHYATECAVEVDGHTSPLERERNRELLLGGLIPTTASTTSDASAKKFHKKRLNLGILRTNRPPAFGDGCKSFDPTISSPLPTSKRRMPMVFRENATTDVDLFTPEPHQKTTQVIISDNPDLYQGWSHANAAPASLTSAGEVEILSKPPSRVFNGTFTQLDELNQRHLITPDPEQLTAAPFT